MNNIILLSILLICIFSSIPVAGQQIGTVIYNSTAIYTSRSDNLNHAANTAAAVNGIVIIDSHNVATSTTLTTTVPVIIKGGTLNNSHAIFFGAGFSNPANAYCFKGSGKIKFATNIEVAPQWWGALGNSSHNDRVAVNQAFQSSTNVYIPSGTYNLGNLSGRDPVAISVKGVTGASYRTDGNVKFVVNTSDNALTAIFLFDNFSNITFGDVSFEDTGLDFAKGNKTGGAQGARAFALSSTNQDSLNFRAGTIYATDVCTPLVSASTSTHRVKGITIDHIYAKHSYYGVNFADNGDDVVIDNLITDNVHRSIILYGVTNHHINLASYNHNTGAFHDVEIIVNAANTYDTSDIHINAVWYGATNDANVELLNLEQRSTSKQMRDIDIYFNDTDGSNQNAVSIRIAAKSGGAVETTSDKIFKNISIRGAAKHYAQIVTPTITKPCYLKIERAIADPLALFGFTISGWIFDYGDTLFLMSYGNLNNLTVSVPYGANINTLIIRKYQLTIVDDAAQFALTTARIAEGIVFGFYNGAVHIDSPIELNNTAKGRNPGTYRITGAGSYITFTFSGWSGNANGRVLLNISN